MTTQDIAKIIWDEHDKWNGTPASNERETWGYKAAARIAAAFNQQIDALGAELLVKLAK